jgi:hypothetical protein
MAQQAAGDHLEITAGEYPAPNQWHEEQLRQHEHEDAIDRAPRQGATREAALEHTRI